MTFVRKTSRAFALCAMLAGLAACSSNPLSNMFGGNDDDENAPADENRKAVLALENTLEVDPAYANISIDLPPPYSNVAWTQPGGDADHTLHHVAANLTLDRDWTADIGAGSDRRAPITAPPVIADGKIFVIDPEAKITAFDASNGRRLWRQALTPDVSEEQPFWKLFSGIKPAQLGFGGGVAYDNGRVFVTSGFGFVAGLNAETGEVLWQHEANAPIRTAPTAANGDVYAVTNVNEFIALDQETGEQNWTHQSFEEAARFLSAASPAVSDDVIVAPFSSGEVAALSAGTGYQLWSTVIARSSRMNALSNLNDIAGSPVIDRGLVFAISHAGQMSAIDLRTGNVVWEVGVAGLQTPWVAGNYIYLVSVEGELICLNRENGAVIWINELPKYEKPKRKKNRLAWTGPVLAGGNLVLASSGGDVILANPSNGEIVNERRVGKGTITTPVVADGKLYILSEDGKLIAIR